MNTEEYQNPMALDRPATDEEVAFAKECVQYLTGGFRHPDSDIIMATFDALLKERDELRSKPPLLLEYNPQCISCGCDCIVRTDKGTLCTYCAAPMLGGGF